MKKKTSKPIAIIAGLIMVFAMSISVYAVEVSSTIEQKIVTSDIELKIEKPLTVKNPSTLQVSGPGVNFTYEITSPAVSGTISDGTSTAVIHSGPAGGLTVDSPVTFASNELFDASHDGTVNTKYITFHTNLNAFNSPGVYRYKLSDTTSASHLESVGVTRIDNYALDRFVDVYIEWNNNGSGLKVSGYVVRDENGSKSTYDPDIYETYNTVITKSVTGNMGDRYHPFPFSIAVSGQNGGFYAQMDNAASAGSTIQNNSTVTAELSHGNSYYLSGLSSNAVLTITESNDTGDIYTVSVNNGDETAVNGGNSYVADPISVSATPEITFVNDFNSVSPTGIVMRYGAPLLALAAAVLLIAINKKSRQKKDPE